MRFKLFTGLLSFVLSFIFKGTFHYILLAVSYIALGCEVIVEAVKSIVEGEYLDENFLMTVATVAAGILGQYNEAVFVMLFYCIGEYAQDLASDRSRKNIEDLINIKPEIVHVDGKDVAPESVEIGTVFTVFPGERVAIDGIVVKGQSFIDTKSITGESTPVNCSVKQEIISGSIVLDSPLEIKTTKAYNDSTVAKIIKLIEQSNETKAPTEKFITKFAKYYTPIVVGAAVLYAIIPSLITGQWHVWVYRALNFMVISCPCALVLSVPLSFFAGIGGCANKGILIKGAEHLESLAKTSAVVFDKTGTLTEGNFKVQKIKTFGAISEEDVLKTAYSLEWSSKHPIALAINSYCAEHKIRLVKAENTVEKSGLGLIGNLKGKQVFAGNAKLLKEFSVKSSKINELGTIVYVGKDGVLLGYIVISDTIKPGAEDMVSDLGKLGIKNTVMLSGDNSETARSTAGKIGLNSCFANLLPLEKLDRMKELRKSHICTYVGDGLNDIPVMLEADTAISMGTIGSDAAIEASDIVITNDSLDKIPLAIKRSRKTMSIVRQNVVFALLCKIICLVLGSLGITGLGLAIFADTGVALLTVFNSMRALS